MISVCIIVKDGAASLRETLVSTQSFPEVILLDNGSIDETLAIARDYPNVQIHETQFKGFGPLRNEAAEKAAHDWILALDADEVLSPPLLQEIASLRLDPNAIYSFLRNNYYNGRWIKGCDWYPERVLRLYHRKRSSFHPSAVHESLQTQGLRISPLSSPLLHTPYRQTADFLDKMQRYSTLFAQQHCHKKRATFGKALFHGFFSFFKSYFWKQGIFLGKEGFLISFYKGSTAFYKYVKLMELNEACQKRQDPAMEKKTYQGKIQ